MLKRCLFHLSLLLMMMVGLPVLADSATIGIVLILAPLMVWSFLVVRIVSRSLLASVLLGIGLSFWVLPVGVGVFVSLMLIRFVPVWFRKFLDSWDERCATVMRARSATPMFDECSTDEEQGKVYAPSPPGFLKDPSNPLDIL